MLIERILRYSKIIRYNGFIFLINSFLKKLGLNFRIKDSVKRKIITYSNYLSKKTNNKISFGPLEGTVLKYNLNKTVLGLKLLGLYEKEVLDEIINYNNKNKKKILVQLGTSDGYFTCGLLKNNFFEKCVAFEEDQKSTGFLKKNIIENNINEKRVIYFGKAEKNFLEQIESKNIELNDCFFLLDIEGDEYKILDEVNLKKLSRSPVIIEMHDILGVDMNMKKNFYGNINKLEIDNHKINIGFRELPNTEILKNIIKSEFDKNLMISESRPYGIYWLGLNLK